MRRLGARERAITAATNDAAVHGGRRICSRGRRPATHARYANRAGHRSSFGFYSLSGYFCLLLRINSREFLLIS